MNWGELKPLAGQTCIWCKFNSLKKKEKKQFGVNDSEQVPHFFFLKRYDKCVFLLHFSFFFWGVLTCCPPSRKTSLLTFCLCVTSLPFNPRFISKWLLPFLHCISFYLPVPILCPLLPGHIILKDPGNDSPSSTRWTLVITQNILSISWKQIEVRHKTTAAKCARLNLPNSWPFSSDDPSKVFSLCMFSELSLELSIHCLHLSPAGSAVLCIVGQRCQSKNCIRQKHSFVFQTSLSALALQWRGLFFVSDRLQLMLWQQQNAALDSISYVKLRS